MGGWSDGPGNTWKMVFDQFWGGIWNTPNQSAQEFAIDGYLPYCVGYRCEIGRDGQGLVNYLTPAEGAATFNSVAFNTDSVGLIFPYFEGNSSGTQLLVAAGSTIIEVNASSLVTITPNLGTNTLPLFAAQALNYAWIGGQNVQMHRYNKANPGSGGKLSYAGTAAPTNQPTMGQGAVAGAGLTSGTFYRYRYSWDYGTGRELGMGWKGSTGGITLTATGNGVTVTMDANPPTSFTHVVSRSLFRNTTAYPSSFFLLTRTDYAGSSLGTTFSDTTSDAAIEAGEETDPINPQDTTSPPFSQLLPPKCTYLCVHKGRLWGLDVVTSDGTRYAQRAVYSRVSPVGPKSNFDQFETIAFAQAAPAEFGEPTGLVAWFGNLYAFFEGGITMLACDPAPGAVTFFTTIVAGRGCVASRTIQVTNSGIVYLSREGPCLFNGTSDPEIISEKVSSVIRASAGFTATGKIDGVGGFSSAFQEYFVRSPGVSSLVYNMNLGQWWYNGEQGLDVATYMTQVGGQLYYGSTVGRIWKYRCGSVGWDPQNNQPSIKSVVFAFSPKNYNVRSRLRRATVVFGGTGTSITLANSISFSSVFDLVTVSTSSFATANRKIWTFSYGPGTSNGAMFHHMRGLINTTLSSSLAVTATENSAKILSVIFEGNYDPERKTVFSDG